MVRGAKQGVGSCWQIRDSKVGLFAFKCKGSDWMETLYSVYMLQCMICKYNEILCVQVKNKPCVRFTSTMHLISWIRPRGSETPGITGIPGIPGFPGITGIPGMPGSHVSMESRVSLVSLISLESVLSLLGYDLERFPILALNPITFPIPELT
jgi:hypothetical protein